jgi:predicted PurR-regulated permease PerM
MMMIAMMMALWDVLDALTESGTMMRRRSLTVMLIVTLIETSRCMLARYIICNINSSISTVTNTTISRLKYTPHTPHTLTDHINTTNNTTTNCYNSNSSNNMTAILHQLIGHLSTALGMLGHSSRMTSMQV